MPITAQRTTQPVVSARSRFRLRPANDFIDVEVVVQPAGRPVVDASAFSCAATQISPPARGCSTCYAMRSTTGGQPTSIMRRHRASTKASSSERVGHKTGRWFDSPANRRRRRSHYAGYLIERRGLPSSPKLPA